MNLQELINAGAQVSLTIGANDLRTFAQTVAAQTRQEIEQQIAEDRMESYVSPKRAAEIFDIDPSTLHRWKMRGYLVPVAVGGKRRYRMSDINDILNHGKKQKA
jgi:transposase-like protein